jgi:hypothetical protein
MKVNVEGFEFVNENISNQADIDKIIMAYGTNIPSTFNTDWEKYMTTISNTLNTYSTNTITTSKRNSTLFQYFKTGVVVYNNSSPSNLDFLFQINKNDEKVELGICEKNIGKVHHGAYNAYL